MEKVSQAHYASRTVSRFGSDIIGSMQHPSGAKYEVSPNLVLTYNRTVLVITGRVC